MSGTYADERRRGCWRREGFDDIQRVIASLKAAGTDAVLDE